MYFIILVLFLSCQSASNKYFEQAKEVIFAERNYEKAYELIQKALEMEPENQEFLKFKMDLEKVIKKNK